MTRWEKKILQIVRKINPEDPIRYVQKIVGNDERKKLDEAIRSCHKCSIADSVKTVTFGATDASILVLTDTALPNHKNAYPDCDSTSWEMTVSTFKFYDIPLTDCFFMNSVNCCPYLKMENSMIYRIPNLNEKKSCKPYLDQAIRIVQPKLIIILGNVALNSMILANINTVHGKTLDIYGIPAIATFSPEYLLWCKKENPDAYECEKNIFFADFEKIKEEWNNVKEQL